jgi:hypothetical protein
VNSWTDTNQAAGRPSPALRRAVLVAMLWSGLGVVMALSLPATPTTQELSPGTAATASAAPRR